MQVVTEPLVSTMNQPERSRKGYGCCLSGTEIDDIGSWITAERGESRNRHVLWRTVVFELSERLCRFHNTTTLIKWARDQQLDRVNSLPPHQLRANKSLISLSPLTSVIGMQMAASVYPKWKGNLSISRKCLRGPEVLGMWSLISNRNILDSVTEIR